MTAQASPTATPRLLVVSQAYPPRPYGVSVLVYRQVQQLALMYRRALGLGEGEPVPIRVVAPQFPGDATAMPPIAGVEEIRFGASTTPIWRVPSMARHVRRHWLSFRPQVVYCPQYRALGPVVMALARWTGVPYVTYWHGTEILTELGNPIRRRILRAYARGASVHMANSRYTCNLVERELGVREGAVVEVNPHLDPAPFDAARPRRDAVRQALGANGRTVLLTAGTMSHRKAMDVVANALILLQRQHPDAVRQLDWWVAGHGPERSRIVQAIAAAGIPLVEGGEAFASGSDAGPRVRLLGVVKPGELAEHFVAADLFALTSRDVPDNVESFGIVYLEAAAAGIPSVAAQVGGVASAVEDGVSGLLVPPDDPAAVAAALHRLLMDPALARRLGTQGRQRLMQGFIPEMVGRKFFGVLSGVAGAPPPAHPTSPISP